MPTYILENPRDGIRSASIIDDNQHDCIFLLVKYSWSVEPIESSHKKIVGAKGHYGRKFQPTTYFKKAKWVIKKQEA